jgi:hypothetical protein
MHKILFYNKFIIQKVKVKIKCSRYRSGVAQRVGRGVALLFHDHSTRMGWVVSSTPRPHFTPGKDPVPILQEAGWAAGPVWTGGKSRLHRDSILDRPARSQSLYRPSYPAHKFIICLYMFRALCAHHQDVKSLFSTCAPDGDLQVWWCQMLYNTILTSWWWAYSARNM